MTPNGLASKKARRFCKNKTTKTAEASMLNGFRDHYRLSDIDFGTLFALGAEYRPPRGPVGGRPPRGLVVGGGPKMVSLINN